MTTTILFGILACVVICICLRKIKRLFPELVEMTLNIGMYLIALAVGTVGYFFFMSGIIGRTPNPLELVIAGVLMMGVILVLLSSSRIIGSIIWYIYSFCVGGLITWGGMALSDKLWQTGLNPKDHWLLLIVCAAIMTPALFKSGTEMKHTTNGTQSMADAWYNADQDREERKRKRFFN